MGFTRWQTCRLSCLKLSNALPVANAPPIPSAEPSGTLAPRVLWSIEGVPVGSLVPSLLEGLALSAAWQQRPDGSWHVQARAAAVDAELAALAQQLATAQRCGVWRNERISVWALGPERHRQRMGAIERATARVLGLDTQAVHLIGEASDGQVWVQQRAFDKPTDPGRWDTLVGGLVGDGERLEQTLRRECLEEAGLHLDQAVGWRWAGHVDAQHPTADAQGRGVLIERLHWAVAHLPEAWAPHNHDGEVAGFACLSRRELKDWLAADRFAPDAAVLLRSYLTQPAGRP